MTIKQFLKGNEVTKGLYYHLKEMKDEREVNNRFNYHGTYIDRSNGRKKLCVILAGYKEYLYPFVFKRIEMYLNNDIDICVATSGRWSEQVNEICKKNGWSYLSTKENNVNLVQNIAIKNHPEAEYIYKLDEDIFITKNYFDKMYNSLDHFTENNMYVPGMIVPVIPLNGFSHIFILKKYGLLTYYEKHYEKPLYMTSPKRKIEKDPSVAKMFWGENGKIPHIDTMNLDFEKNEESEEICPIKFSIGAILFPRSTWEEMGYYSVSRHYPALGVDEQEICSFCMLKSKPIIMSLNTVVGHFSFGNQTESMKLYLRDHPEMFEIKSE